MLGFRVKYNEGYIGPLAILDIVVIRFTLFGLGLIV